jgi:polar amino acid transport system substrate-binding protein
MTSPSTAKLQRPALLVMLSVVTALMFGGCGGSSNSSSDSTGPAPKLVAKVSSHSVIRRGTLTICSDIPLPPFEQYDANNNLVGFEVDLVNQLAPRMGLKPVWVNSVFDTIIAALQGGKCDAIIGDMFITPDRSKQIRQIPYLTEGEQFLVRKGNPDHLNPADPSTLCGKILSIELGNAEVADAQQYSKACVKKGKPAITILQPQKMPDSLLQLQTGHAQAVFNDSPIVQYYAKLQPSAFQLAGPVLKDNTQIGIGVAKTNSSLITAFIAALKNVESDGTYAHILAKWGFQNPRVPSPQ